MCECVYWLLYPLIKLCFTLVNGNSTELNVNWRGYSHRQALGHTHTLTRIKFLTNMLSNKYLGSTPILFKNETFYKFPKPLYFCLCSDTAKRRKKKQFEPFTTCARVCCTLAVCISMSKIKGTTLERNWGHKDCSCASPNLKMKKNSLGFLF